MSYSYFRGIFNEVKWIGWMKWVKWMGRHISLLDLMKSLKRYVSTSRFLQQLKVVEWWLRVSGSHSSSHMYLWLFGYLMSRDKRNTLHLHFHLQASTLAHWWISFRRYHPKSCPNYEYDGGIISRGKLSPVPHDL